MNKEAQMAAMVDRQVSKWDMSIRYADTPAGHYSICCKSLS